MSKAKTNTLFIIALVLVTILSMVQCDIPAHCRKESIEGDWKFVIDKNQFTPSLSNEETTCGHGFPDKIDQTVGDKDVSFASSTIMIVTLGHDYKAYQKGAEVGTWTPIYDEGFILYLGKMVFFNYMKYFKTNNGPYKSNCNKTMKGWVIPDKDEKHRNWSCFYGLKIKGTTCTHSFLKEAKKKGKGLDPIFNEKAQSTEGLQDKEALSFVQFKGLAYNAIHEKYEDQSHIVDALNNMGLTWSAGIHEGFKGMSLLELNNHPQLGVKRMEYQTSSQFKNLMKFDETTSLLQVNTNGKTKKGAVLETDDDVKVFNEATSEVEDKSSDTSSDKELNPSEIALKSDGKREPDSQHVTEYSDVARYINKDIRDIDEKTLSKNWDWRNVGGKNYVPNQREQKSCGSCYIFSSLSSLEARLRIQTDNQDQTEFSRQFIVSCGIYTEGCKGGYPVLVGKFANEFELATDSCMDYQASTTECKPCDLSKFKYKYTVDKYGYNGGFYGATNELEMMKEIRARGPTPGNISVPWSFSYYKGGIYSHFHNKTPNKTISSLTMFDRNVTWEKVDHSILIIGWGEDNGVPYWLCMNTWGSAWGEDGYFKILRGKNECSIETMGDVLTIKKELR